MSRLEYARRLIDRELQGERRDGPGGPLEVSLRVDASKHPAEGFVIEVANSIDAGGPPGGVTITAGDGTGAIYGAHRLIELMRDGAELVQVLPLADAPRLAFRAIKYDLPWDTYRHSTALSLHEETCADIDYWEAFLDMMCENRFNVLTLWNLHPYPLLIRPENFPEASPWSDEEMDRWRRLFGSIFELAHERGIETYLVPFNIFVPPEFSRVHGVALDNLDHHFFVRGDTSPIIVRYTRECVAQVLREYPLLTGFGLTLGEGMAGMTPAERETWIRETIVAGMRDSGRRCKLIHRVPFSGGTGSAGDTTREMEAVTREGIEAEAAMEFIEQPVWAGMKFNWSHPLSTPRLVKVHGGRLFGTYFDPPPEGYRVVWTARNEDIFCLRWGVPGFVRDHIRNNSHDYVGGYIVGSETYIPAADYFTRDEAVGAGGKPWRYAFERQWLFYAIWGRLLYDRETPDDLFRAAFRRRYGAAGEPLFEAHALAGRMPLRLGFSFDVTWDFTLYAEGFMALDPDRRRVELISIERLISHPPLDPSYVRVADFARILHEHREPDRGAVTPHELADALESDATAAREIAESIALPASGPDAIALRFEQADVLSWCELGLYFAWKLRAAVALARGRLANDADRAELAAGLLERAAGHWESLVGITRPLYADMPLVHLSEQDGRPWHENDHLRFHWEHLLPDVHGEVAAVRAEAAAIRTGRTP